MHLLPRQPHLLLKSYRRPADRSHLEDLVAWPARSGEDAAARIGAAAAWPCSVVTGGRGEAVGLLMPRAPRRFSVRHRDGRSRLASLSYLTSDPVHRAVAYGLELPAPASPDRVGLVYALARLLAAFEEGSPSVGHGDLSTKNVLWSLQRGPEVFVIDCDNSDFFGPDGRPATDDRPASDDRPATDGGRRRAMTPNWDDPAVPRGQNPTAATDRYSLALIFLRVVGAANFPIQARQRSGDRVEIRFPAPEGPLLDPAAAVWQLCARGLTLGDVAARPAAAEWLGPLECLLDRMGAAGPVRAAVHGRGAPSPVVHPRGPAPADVVIVPELAPRRERTWTRVSPAPRFGPAPSPTGGPASRGSFGYRTVALSRPARPYPASAQHGAAPTWVRPTSARPPGPTAAGPTAPGATAPGATGPGATAPGATGPARPGPAPPGGAPGSAPPSPWLSTGATAPIWPEVRAQLVRFLHWWAALHVALLDAFRAGGRRSGRVRAVLFCVSVDFTVAMIALAIVGLVVSPLIVG